MTRSPYGQNTNALAWEDIPLEERRRLQRNERAQRYRTRKRGLPVLPISIEGLWLVQSGMCTCNECRGRVPLEIGRIVVAHPHYRAGKGSPGHVPTNVSLWNMCCNQREAANEIAALAKSRRMAVQKSSDLIKTSHASMGRHHNGWNQTFKRKLNGQVVKR